MVTFVKNWSRNTFLVFKKADPLATPPPATPPSATPLEASETGDTETESPLEPVLQDIPSLRRPASSDTKENVITPSLSAPADEIARPIDEPPATSYLGQPVFGSEITTHEERFPELQEKLHVLQNSDFSTHEVQLPETDVGSAITKPIEDIIGRRITQVAMSEHPDDIGANLGIARKHVEGEKRKAGYGVVRSGSDIETHVDDTGRPKIFDVTPMSQIATDSPDFDTSHQVAHIEGTDKSGSILQRVVHKDGVVTAYAGRTQGRDTVYGSSTETLNDRPRAEDIASTTATYIDTNTGTPRPAIAVRKVDNKGLTITQYFRQPREGTIRLQDDASIQFAGFLASTYTATGTSAESPDQGADRVKQTTYATGDGTTHRIVQNHVLSVASSDGKRSEVSPDEQEPDDVANIDDMKKEIERLQQIPQGSATLAEQRRLVLLQENLAKHKTTTFSVANPLAPYMPSAQTSPSYVKINRNLANITARITEKEKLIGNQSAILEAAKKSSASGRDQAIERAMKALKALNMQLAKLTPQQDALRRARAMLLSPASGSSATMPVKAGLRVAVVNQSRPILSWQGSDVNHANVFNGLAGAPLHTTYMTGLTGVNLQRRGAIWGFRDKSMIMDTTAIPLSRLSHNPNQANAAAISRALQDTAVTYPVAGSRGELNPVSIHAVLGGTPGGPRVVVNNLSAGLGFTGVSQVGPIGDEGVHETSILGFAPDMNMEGVAFSYLLSKFMNWRVQDTVDETTAQQTITHKGSILVTHASHPQLWQEFVARDIIEPIKKWEAHVRPQDITDDDREKYQKAMAGLNYMIALQSPNANSTDDPYLWPFRQPLRDMMRFPGTIKETATSTGATRIVPPAQRTIAHVPGGPDYYVPYTHLNFNSQQNPELVALSAAYGFPRDWRIDHRVIRGKMPGYDPELDNAGGAWAQPTSVGSGSVLLMRTMSGIDPDVLTRMSGEARVVMPFAPDHAYRHTLEYRTVHGPRHEPGDMSGHERAHRHASPEMDRVSKNEDHNPGKAKTQTDLSKDAQLFVSVNMGLRRGIAVQQFDQQTGTPSSDIVTFPFANMGTLQNGVLNLVPRPAYDPNPEYVATGSGLLVPQMSDGGTILTPALQGLVVMANNNLSLVDIHMAAAAVPELDKDSRTSVLNDALMLRDPWSIYEQLFMIEEERDGEFLFNPRVMAILSPENALMGKDGKPIRTVASHTTAANRKTALQAEDHAHLTMHRAMGSIWPSRQKLSFDGAHRGRLALPDQVAPTEKTIVGSRPWYDRFSHRNKPAIPMGIAGFGPHDTMKFTIGGETYDMSQFSHNSIWAPTVPLVPEPGKEDLWKGPKVGTRFHDALIRMPETNEIIQMPINANVVKDATTGKYVSAGTPTMGNFLPLEGQQNTLGGSGGSDKRELGHDITKQAVVVKKEDGTTIEIPDRNRVALSAMWCFRKYYPEEYKLLKERLGITSPADGSEDLDAVMEQVWGISDPTNSSSRRILEIGPGLAMANATPEQILDTPELARPDMHHGQRDHILKTISDADRALYPADTGAVDAGINRGFERVPWLTLLARTPVPGSAAWIYARENNGQRPPPGHPAHQEWGIIHIPGNAGRTEARNFWVMSHGERVNLFEGENRISELERKKAIMVDLAKRFYASDAFKKGDYTIIPVFDTPTSSKIDTDLAKDPIASSRTEKRPIGAMIKWNGLLIPIIPEHITFSHVLREKLGNALNPNSWITNEEGQIVPHVDKELLWNQTIRLMQKIKSSGQGEKLGIPEDADVSSSNRSHYQLFERVKSILVNINNPMYSSVPKNDDETDFLRTPSGEYAPEVIEELGRIVSSQSYRERVEKLWYTRQARMFLEKYQELMDLPVNANERVQGILKQEDSYPMVADELPTLGKTGDSVEKNVASIVTETNINSVATNPLIVMELARFADPSIASEFKSNRDDLSEYRDDSASAEIIERDGRIREYHNDVVNTMSPTEGNAHTSYAEDIAENGISYGSLSYISNMMHEEMMFGRDTLGNQIQTINGQKLRVIDLFPDSSLEWLKDARILGEDAWGKVREAFIALKKAQVNGASADNIAELKEVLEKAQKNLGNRQYSVMVRQISWFKLLPERAKLAYVAMLKAGMYGDPEQLRLQIPDEGTLAPLKNVAMRLLGTNPILESLDKEQHEGFVTNGSRVYINESIIHEDPLMPKYVQVSPEDQQDFDEVRIGDETGPITVRRLLVPKIKQDAARAIFLTKKMMFGEVKSQSQTLTKIEHITLEEIRELKELLQTISPMDPNSQSLHRESPNNVGGIEAAIRYLQSVSLLNDADWNPEMHDFLANGSVDPQGHRYYMMHAIEILKHYFGIGEHDVLHTIEHLKSKHMVQLASQQASLQMAKAVTAIDNAQRHRQKGLGQGIEPPEIHQDYIHSADGIAVGARALTMIHPEMQQPERLHEIALEAEDAAKRVYSEIEGYFPRITNPDPSQDRKPQVPSMTRIDEADDLHNAPVDNATREKGMFKISALYREFTRDDSYELEKNNVDNFLANGVPDDWNVTTMFKDMDLLHKYIGVTTEEKDDPHIIGAKLANAFKQGKFQGLLVAAFCDKSLMDAPMLRIINSGQSTIDRKSELYRLFVTHGIVLTIDGNKVQSYDTETPKDTMATNNDRSVVINDIKLSSLDYARSDKSPQATKVDNQLTTSIKITIRDDGSIDFSELTSSINLLARIFQASKDESSETKEIMEKRVKLIDDAVKDKGIPPISAEHLELVVPDLAGIEGGPRTSIVAQHKEDDINRVIYERSGFEVPNEEILANAIRKGVSNEPDTDAVLREGTGNHFIVISTNANGLAIVWFPVDDTYAYDYDWHSEDRQQRFERNMGDTNAVHAAQISGALGAGPFDSENRGPQRPPLVVEKRRAAPDAGEPKTIADPMQLHRQSASPLAPAFARDAITRYNGRWKYPFGSGGGFFGVVKLPQNVGIGGIGYLNNIVDPSNPDPELTAEDQNELERKLNSIEKQLEDMGTGIGELTQEQKTQIRLYEKSNEETKAVILAENPNLEQVIKIANLEKEHEDLLQKLSTINAITMTNNNIINREDILKIIVTYSTLNRHSIKKWVRAIALAISEKNKLTQLRQSAPSEIIRQSAQEILEDNESLFIMRNEDALSSKNNHPNVHIIPSSMSNKIMGSPRELPTISEEEVISVLDSFPQFYKDMLFEGTDGIHIYLHEGDCREIPAEFLGANPDGTSRTPPDRPIAIWTIGNNIHIDTTSSGAIIRLVNHLAQIINIKIGRNLQAKDADEYDPTSEVRLTTSKTMQQWLDYVRRRVKESIDQYGELFSSSADEMPPMIAIANHLGLNDQGEVPIGESDSSREKAALFLIEQSLFYLIQNNRTSTYYSNGTRQVIVRQPNAIVTYRSPFLIARFSGKTAIMDLESAPIFDAKSVSIYKPETIESNLSRRNELDRAFANKEITADEHRAYIKEIEKETGFIAPTEEQYQIIMDRRSRPGRPQRLFVQAVAGAGKTTTLKLSILDAIALGEDANSIAVLVFARHAADLLLSRYNESVPYDIRGGKSLTSRNKGIIVNTFHGFIKGLLLAKTPMRRAGDVSEGTENNFEMQQLYSPYPMSDRYLAYTEDGWVTDYKEGSFFRELSGESPYGRSLTTLEPERKFSQVNDPSSDIRCTNALKKILESLHTRTDQGKFSDARVKIVMDAITLLKSAGIQPWEYEKYIHGLYDKNEKLSQTEIEVAYCYPRYQRQMENLNLIDQGDHFLIFLNVIERYPELLEGWLHKRFPNLYFDEAQDWNGVMIKIIKAMTGKNTSIYAVGDESQAIMGSFRGGNEDVFEKIRGPLGMYMKTMQDSLRSTTNIVEFSNLFRKKGGALAKALPTMGDGDKVRNVRFDSIDTRNSFLIAQIKKVLENGIKDGNGKHLPMSPKDIMILTRTNREARDAMWKFLDETGGKIPAWSPSFSRSTAQKLKNNITILNNLIACAINPFNIDALASLSRVRGWNLFASVGKRGGRIDSKIKRRWTDSINDAKKEGLSPQQWLEKILNEVGTLIKTEDQLSIIQDILEGHKLINRPDGKTSDAVYHFLGTKRNAPETEDEIKLKQKTNEFSDTKFVPHGSTKPRFPLFGKLIRSELGKTVLKRQGNSFSLGQLGEIESFLSKILSDQDNLEASKPTTDRSQQISNALQFLDNLQTLQVGRGTAPFSRQSIRVKAGARQKQILFEVPGKGSNAIQFSTAHFSKGSERPLVIAIGDYPSVNAIRQGHADEEQRLFYVLASRAKFNLQILTVGENPFLNNKELLKYMTRVTGNADGSTSTSAGGSVGSNEPPDPRIPAVRFNDEDRIRTLHIPDQHALDNAGVSGFFPSTPKGWPNIFANIIRIGNPFIPFFSFFKGGSGITETVHAKLTRGVSDTATITDEIKKDEDKKHVNPAEYDGDVEERPKEESSEIKYDTLEIHWYPDSINSSIGDGSIQIKPLPEYTDASGNITAQSIMRSLGFDMKFSPNIVVDGFRVSSLNQFMNDMPTDVGDPTAVFFNTERHPEGQHPFKKWAQQISSDDSHGFTKANVLKILQNLIDSNEESEASSAKAFVYSLKYLKQTLLSEGAGVTYHIAGLPEEEPEDEDGEEGEEGEEAFD